MPVKTDEATRNLIVNLRREGKTYGEIQREAGVAGPTVASVLKEAGMTQAKKPPVRKSATANTSSSKSPQAVGNAAGAIRPGTGNGVDDLQPPAGPKRVKAQPVDEEEEQWIQCDKCGVMLRGKPGDPLPDKCPECGQ